MSDEPASFNDLVVQALEGGFRDDVDAVEQAPRSWEVVTSDYLRWCAQAMDIPRSDRS